MPSCRSLTVVTLAIFSSLSVVDKSLAASNMTSDSQSTRPIDRGLRPLYVMTETFLDVVQPVSRGFVFDDPRFNAGMFSS